jgi:hypothetical protein
LNVASASRWTTPVARTLLCGALAALAWWLPPLRATFVSLEPAVGPGLFFIGLAGGIAALLGRPARGLQARILRIGGRHGWWLCAALFLLPLWSQWSSQPPSSVSAHTALFGVLPWGDATGHYEGGVRLLEEGEFLTYSARRPLHACWLAFRLAIGRGSVPFALAFQSLLLGAAAFLLSRSLALRFGAWPAVAVLGASYALTRDYAAAVLTEPLGILFGCLAAAILLTGRARRNLGALALGFFALEMGLRARPGAQFLLPALAVWAVAAFPGRRLKAAGVVVAVFLAGSLHTTLLNKLYSSGEATFTSHVARTLYGLARGGNYEQADADLGVDDTRPEAEQASGVWRAAFAEIAAHPSVFVGSLVHNESRFLTKAPVTLSQALSPRWLLQPTDERMRPTSAEIRRDYWWGGALLLLAAALAVLHLARRERGSALFWAAAAVGVLASAPFIYSDTGFRALAPSYPFIAAFLALGAASRVRTRARTQAAKMDHAEQALVRAAGGIAVGLAVVAAIGPLAVRPLWPRMSSSGAAAGEALIDLRTAPLVVIRNPLEPADYGRLRTLDRPDFLRLVRYADLKGELGPLTQRRPPFAVLSCYEKLSTRVHLYVAPIEMAQAGGVIAFSAAPFPGAGSEQFEEITSWHRPR